MFLLPWGFSCFGQLDGSQGCPTNKITSRWQPNHHRIIEALSVLRQNEGECGSISRFDWRTAMADDINHWVPTQGMGQKTRQQCWYASYKMIYRVKGLNTDLVKQKLEKVIDFPDAMKNGLLDNDFLTCAGALDLTSWSGRHFNMKRDFWDMGMSDGAETLYACLRKGPLWVSRKTSSGSFHITVLKGYKDSGDKFIFNNPFPGPNDAIEQSMKSDLYARRITFAAGSVQR